MVQPHLSAIARHAEYDKQLTMVCVILVPDGLIPVVAPEFCLMVSDKAAWRVSGAFAVLAVHVLHTSMLTNCAHPVGFAQVDARL